ncbi:MAG TPA: Fur family transcriptional regulator [Hyphomicrobiaceae bacterium]|nr:Fur family transcriptional regulator [Hyphomicrobiaceae bacterium]
MHQSSEKDISEVLRRAGLRPTRQRVALARLLFAGGDRHVTAEMLHEEAVRVGQRVSLATVYNTLHQFKRAGLLREIAVCGQRAHFDTNTSNHNHYFIEGNNSLIDIPGNTIRVEGLPTPPDDLKIAHIDVVVRLVEK